MAGCDCPRDYAKRIKSEGIKYNAAKFVGRPFFGLALKADKAAYVNDFKQTDQQRAEGFF